MKRKILVLVPFVFAVLSLCLSCDLLGGLTSSLLPWNATTESYNSSSGVMYELPFDTKTLNLTVNGPSDIYFVKMNPSERAIYASNTRYVVSATRAADNSPSIDSLSEETNALPVRKDFKPAQDFVWKPLEGASSTRAASGISSAVSAPQKSVTQINPVVGTTTKRLWVDDGNASENKYSQKKATLRATGTYCYVWVIDDYYTSSSSTSETQKVTGNTAEALAAKFDKIYSYVRHIFGNEADYIVDVANGAETYSNIAAVSDTGTKVNIVVYDIYDDYNSSESGGVYGYFWSKDYFSEEYAAALGSSADVIAYTNQGKYFYVDSHFTNTDTAGIYSTLAHEFQHMINFGVKTLIPAKNGKQSATYSTWYTEMLSMLCEDMMQEFLQVEDKNSPLSRLPWFCLGYPYSGVIDWLDGNEALYSYATAYTFGAYLARNFGGPDLVRKIATNSYVDRDSITRALQEKNYNETFDTVFAKYSQALVLDNPSGGAAVSLNKAVKLDSAYNGYSYPMKAIDIFNVKYDYGSSGTEYISPQLLASSSQVTLRPYGFTLHSVGYTQNAGTVSLEFSRPYSYAEKDYILVQPCNHTSH